MSTFTSPVPSNVDETGIAPSPNALAVPVVQSIYPDIETYLVPAGAGYNTTTLPLRISGGDGHTFYVNNGQVTDLLVVGVDPTDPGVVVPAGVRMMLGTTAAGRVFTPGGTSSGAGSPTMSVATRTLLATTVAPVNGREVWVDEVHGFYKFDSASVLTSNTVTVITSTLSGTGRWIYQSMEIMLPVAGAGLDDWANMQVFQSSIAQSAALNITQPVLVLNGAYEVRTQQTLNNIATKIRGTPRTTITMFLAASGIQQNSAFYWVPVPIATSTTLNGNATVGARTLVVTAGAAFPNGGIIRVRQGAAPGLLISYFKIISGGGTNTLTLDRPIVYPFLNADVVTLMASVPTGQIIEGNGMTISGTGDRAVEIIGGRECVVSDVFVNTGLSDSAISFDLGSYSCTMERCTVDMGNTATTFGVMLETAEACVMRDCVALRCGSAGIFMVDSVQCTVASCQAYACVNAGAVGGYFGTSDGAANPAGNVVCRVDDCTFNDNTTGALCGANTTCDWKGCSSRNSTGTDNWSIGGGQGTLRCRWIDCDSSGGLAAAVNGWNFDVSNLSPVMSGCQANSAPGAGVGLAIACGSFFANNFTSLLCGGGAILTAATVTDCHLTSMTLGGPTAGAVSVINAVLGAGSRLFIRDARIDFSVAGSVGVNQTGASSIVELQDLEVGGGGAGFGYNGNANTVMRRLGRIAMSNTAVPYTVVEPDQGTFVANGAAAVAVPFRDLRAGAFVAITRNVNGGAPGIMPFYTLVPATGFNATSVAGDTSTYGFKIFD